MKIKIICNSFILFISFSLLTCVELPRATFSCINYLGYKTDFACFMFWLHVKIHTTVKVKTLPPIFNKKCLYCCDKRFKFSQLFKLGRMLRLNILKT